MRSSLCFLSLAALASCENQRKSIVFTFVVINGTLTPVAKNIGNNGGTDDDEAAITKEVLQAILLGIIVITGISQKSKDSRNCFKAHSRVEVKG